MPKYEHIPAGGILAEYAKSNRSMCKKCNKLIGEGHVRLGLMVQSRFFDGVTPTWTHIDCCFKSTTGKSLGKPEEIFGFEELRWDDQEKVRKAFQAMLASIGDDRTEAGRRAGFRVEYAKSNKSKCRGCEDFIEKDVPRLSFLIDGPYGPAPAWHHFSCFLNDHADMLQSAEDFAGWKALEQQDLNALKELVENAKTQSGSAVSEQVPATAENKSPNILPSDINMDEKKESAGIAESSGAVEPNPAALQKQSKLVWAVKDWLVQQLSAFSLKQGKAILLEVLQLNGFVLSEKASENDLKDVVADALCFGVPKKCPTCQQSRLVWDSVTGLFECPVHEAWGRCTYTCTVDETETEPLSVPKDCPIPGFARKIPKQLPKRLVPKKAEKFKYKSAQDLGKGKPAADRPESSVEESKRIKLTLKGRAAVDPESGMDETHHVLEQGGKVYGAILASSDASTGRNSYYKLQVLEGDWVTERPEFTRSGRKKVKSGHGSASYYVFRSWGRVGTTIGDCRLERCADKEAAIEHFEQLFLEKTGNEFGQPSFVKKPKMFYPLELSTPSEDLLQAADSSTIKPGSKTALSKPVQDLLRLIFDVEAMRRALLEMEIDLTKMPLGQLSRKQIEHAYAVLKQAMDAIGGEQAKSQVLRLTNQFYTLIPHDFGYKTPPLLDNSKVIQEKLEMLETLMDIEVATNIIKQEKTDAKEDMDPLDLHYQALHADLEALDKEQEAYKMICEYVATTHGKTHTEYAIEVEQVYAVRRHTEPERYMETIQRNPHLLKDRKLLWHGSRVTNFVGILSQGLRIAPPEAPVTGYMFGKGIYFSDIVSKSANYCRPHARDQTEGLLVLSEVALGEMYEKMESEFIKQLPTGKHSTKGLGKTMPAKVVPFPALSSPLATNSLSSPAEEVASPKPKRRKTRLQSAKEQMKVQGNVGVECPMGPLVENPAAKKSDLLYNEYIVYDEGQSVMRYLVKVKFLFPEPKRGRVRR